jgi:hypothetical protein
MVCIPVLAPVQRITACRASLAASTVVVRVYGVLVDEMVVVAATAESSKAVMLVLTRVPQFVMPSAGRARPRSGVDAI